MFPATTAARMWERGLGSANPMALPQTLNWKFLTREAWTAPSYSRERDSLAQRPLQPLSLACPAIEAGHAKCAFSAFFTSLDECMAHFWPGEYRWFVSRSLGTTSCLPAMGVTLSFFSSFLPWPRMSYLGLQQHVAQLWRVVRANMLRVVEQLKQPQSPWQIFWTVESMFGNNWLLDTWEKAAFLFNLFINQAFCSLQLFPFPADTSSSSVQRWCRLWCKGPGQSWWW